MLSVDAKGLLCIMRASLRRKRCEKDGNSVAHDAASWMVLMKIETGKKFEKTY